MDNQRFDVLARIVARKRTRRGMLAAAVGAVTAAVSGRGAAAQLLPTGWPFTGIACGGIASLPCPAGFSCEIDYADPACHTDCMGVCRPNLGNGVPTNPCAAITCAFGDTCCPNCGGICVPGGTVCGDGLCAGAGEVCGPTVCAPGQTCCNASCGYCTGPDEACTEEFCVSEACGANVCGLGEYYCNESCGICAPIGGACTMQLCLDDGGEQCGSVQCGVGEYCCNESCGYCAPLGGGCTREFCSDEPLPVTCGPTICAAGEVCCNESCGICTPPDGFCTQQFCG